MPRPPKPRQLPSTLFGGEAALTNEVGGHTLHYELPCDPERVIVSSLNLRRAVVVVEPQQKGVARPRPQRQTLEEACVFTSGEITEGRAEEENVQRSLWRIWGGGIGHYVRTVLRGTGSGGLRVSVRHGRQVPQALEGEALAKDLGDGASTLDATFLNKLEAAVVSAPHSLGGDFALEAGADVRGGQFGEGALELRLLEIECVVSDRRAGAVLVDQAR